LAPIQVDLSDNLLVLPAFGGQENHTNALLKSRFDAAALKKHPQLMIGGRIQLNLLGNSHGSSLMDSRSRPKDLSSLTSRALNWCRPMP